MSNFLKRAFWGCLFSILAVLPLSAQTGFRFVVWADATDLLPFVVTNAAQIRQLSVPPRFNLFIGDLYDTGFNLTAVAALQTAMDGDEANSLSGTLFPVRGNHDISGGTNATTGWMSYFDVAKRVAGGDAAKGVPGIGGGNYSAMPGYDSLTYSFDYQNSHFVGMDIPGDVTLVKTSQLSWLDNDLAAAERRGMQHAFLFWHGPVYACGDRHGGINAPATMIAVLNKHPIVAAIFGGHTHVAAWTHMFTNRIASITHPFEGFNIPPVAESLAAITNMNRCEYGFGNLRGFATVDVQGSSYTFSFYVQDDPSPRWTKTFSHGMTLQSPSLLRGGDFRFNLEGEAGFRYRTESSTNLLDWQVIRSIDLRSPTDVPVTITAPSGAVQQFYRCVTVP